MAGSSVAVVISAKLAAAGKHRRPSPGLSERGVLPAWGARGRGGGYFWRDLIFMFPLGRRGMGRGLGRFGFYAPVCRGAPSARLFVCLSV